MVDDAVEKNKPSSDIKQTHSSDKSDNVTLDDREFVYYRNNFYRDNYRRLILICFMLVSIIIGLIAFAFYLHSSRPVPSFYATTYDGKLIRLTPMNEPNLSTNALLTWVTEAATASYTFNFVNWKEALESVRIYYTATGYQHFLNALRDGGNLDTVRSKKLVVSAVPTGAPVILKEGLINKNYTWQVQLPMLLTYQSANDVIKQEITMTMLVSRVPTLESAKGVGIAQLIVSEGRLPI